MAGPLAGVRILEFSEIIAAPFGGMLLADMGADVIKVEPPWGEPWRLQSQFIPLESKTYIGLNRGKRSLPLDLAKPQAKEIVYKLIPNMDVVITNYRPDVPAKLGIDYQTLSAINPRLIYCYTSAYGRQGPHSTRPGYDIIIQGFSGLMTAEGKLNDNAPQQLVSTALADFSTGIVIAWAVCAALYARERTGQGQMIDTTLLGTALALQSARFFSVEAVDAEWRQRLLAELAQARAQGRSYPEILALVQSLRPQRPAGNIYYRTYQTADGVIAVGCLSDPLRKKLLEVLGLYDIRFEPDYDPTSQRAQEFGEKLAAQAETLFRQKTTQEWLQTLDAAGVPCGPVLFTEELLDDPQVRANDLVVELDHSLAGPLRMVGPIVQMDKTPPEVKAPSPALGQHTEEILSALGYDAAAIQRLREEGVTY